MFLHYSGPSKKKKLVQEDVQEAVKQNIGIKKNVLYSHPSYRYMHNMKCMST